MCRSRSQKTKNQTKEPIDITDHHQQTPFLVVCTLDTGRTHQVVLFLIKSSVATEQATMMSISKYLENGGRNSVTSSFSRQQSKNIPQDDLLSVWTEDVEAPNADNKNNNEENEETTVITTGFATSHPRQQRIVAQQKVQKQQQQQQQDSSNNPNTQQSSRRVPLPTDSLTRAVATFEQHVPLTRPAQRDWDRIHEALQALAAKLQPPKTLRVRSKYLFHAPIPTALRQPWKNRQVYIHKATYEANDPTEDRSTIVVGEDFLFAGVWDGHGGMQCSEFTQSTVFENFAQAYQSLADQKQEQRIQMAFVKAFQKTNLDYYHYARTQNERQAYFAGTCACACFLDWSGGNNGDNPQAGTTGTTVAKSGSTATLYCANLGDSRAVLGSLQKDGTFSAKPLSVDHTAENLLERQRIQALHPYDPHVVVDLSSPSQTYPDKQHAPSDMAEPPDWRVKKIAAFTRSIGDLQLKEKNTSALFNSYMAPENRIMPRPGIVRKNSNVPTPPYISTDAEVQQVLVPGMGRYDLSSSANPSFVIIACDGVWDEMTSEEAVDCVGDLLSQYPNRTEVNIAELFIEKVLEQVVERLRETDEDEKDLTLHEFKQRPKGKATDRSRSLLHDDITVIIIQLGSGKAFYRGRRARSGRGLGGRNASVTSLKSLQKAMLRKHSNRISDPMRVIEERLQKHDPERLEKDKQIMAMNEYFTGMNLRHLKILFSALDVDGNGTLDREEIERLINQVMLTNVSPDVVALAFEEMDTDHSGAVDFLEFVSFFGHQAGKDEGKREDIAEDTQSRRFSLL